MFKIYRPKDNEEWLKLRSTVLTATDMSTVLGLNPYKSVKEMQEGKENPTFKGNAYTWIGMALEPVVVQAFNELMHLDIKLFEDELGKVIYADTKLGLGATPDAGNKEYLLECKTTKPGNFLKYAYWPPVIYLCQLYTQLICTDLQQGYLAIMSTNLTQVSEELNLPIHIHYVFRSPELDALFIKHVKRYWEAEKNKKQFRVDRKDTETIELLLRKQCWQVNNGR